VLQSYFPFSNWKKVNLLLILGTKNTHKKVLQGCAALAAAEVIVPKTTASNI